MIILSIRCDSCGRARQGIYGQVGHQIRREARKEGWTQRLRDWITINPSGPIDICPDCCKKVKEYYDSLNA